MSAEPESPQIASASDEKARLECEKLKAEINAINKPLIRTPGFYSALAPVALAILGLAFSWWSGWFDVQRTRISNGKTLLEAQTERLKGRTDDFGNKIAGTTSCVYESRRRNPSA